MFSSKITSRSEKEETNHRNRWGDGQRSDKSQNQPNYS